MVFGEIFWPIVTALIVAFLFEELFHLSLGYWFHKKQQRAALEFEAKVASGEIDPMKAMLSAAGMPPASMPTSSGTPEVPSGQYL